VAQLLGDPRRAHLPGGVADAQPGERHTATAAHDGHPTKSWVVSTCTGSSLSSSEHARTRHPGNPNIPATVSG